MTTITTQSGRIREVPDGLAENLVEAKIVGLDEDGRFVVDTFNMLEQPEDGGFLFGLTLCCNASDKGVEDGIVCRGCYSYDETGNYLFWDAATKSYPGLDPIAGVA